MILRQLYLLFKYFAFIMVNIRKKIYHPIHFTVYSSMTGSTAEL